MTARPTGASPAAATASAIRRLPLPVSAPPFDDEVDAERPVQGALALDFALPGGLPARPSPQLRLVEGVGPRATGRSAAAEAERWGARQPTAADALPDPRAWAARLVQGMVEVLAGERPVQQLARWTDERLYAELTLRARGAARRAARRAAQRGTRAGRSEVRPYVRSVHTCALGDGVVEATAVVQVGNRVRAVALRLEGLDGRWRATVARVV